MTDAQQCSANRHWLTQQGFIGDPTLHEFLGGMSQDHWEYAIAHKILSTFMKPPEAVLEIGVYGGWTMMGWLLLGAKQAVALDIWKRPSAPLPSNVTFIEADSHKRETLARVKQALPNGVDFLFIDGDHSLEGCEADYNMYAPLVRPGGAIGYHDILDGGVRSTWREMVKRYPTVQIQNTNPDGSRLGLGLVFRLPHVTFEPILVSD